MPAHVEEGSNLPVGSADDDEALAGDLDRLEGARFNQLRSAHGANPQRREDAFLLGGVDLGLDVVPPGKSREEARRHVSFGHGFWRLQWTTCRRSGELAVQSLVSYDIVTIRTVDGADQ